MAKLRLSGDISGYIDLVCPAVGPNTTYTFDQNTGSVLTSGNITKQAQIAFGNTPVDAASFVIVDGTITTSTIMVGTVAYVAPSGKDLDEIEMDSLSLTFAPGTGQFTVYVKALDGYVAGNFYINYTNK